MADTSLQARLAAAPSARDMLGWVARGEVGLAVGVVGIIVLLILPIPAFMLDVLLAISITSAVLILMTSLLIKKPLEFTGFPMVLLVTTLFRLSLNIASTRLILGHGHEGVHGAGHIIEAFGKLMMGGSFAIGLIVFAINVIGGILIGVLQHHVPISQALSSYTIMTVGDGLVSQIPALVISIAAGFLVSKSGVEGAEDKALVAQLAMNPVSLGMVSAAAGVIALVPGMPLIPFAAISMGAGALAWRRSQQAL